MPSRPSWEGFLRFNLISVPVKAYSAAVSGGGKIGFHLIHKKCNSRIRYKKACPVHGEVHKDEIVSGYEIAKGQYVVVDPAELDKFRTENDKAISIEAFIHQDALDPVYFSGRNYYLIPDGKVAQKPYSVLQEVMADQHRYAIAQVVFSGREQLAAVRPVGNLLALALLNYSDQIKKPAAFESDVTHAAVSAEERKLAETLIEQSTAEDLDLDRFKDEYTAKVAKLIEAKSKGKKIVAARAQEEPAIINLMDALRQSLDRTQKSGAGKKSQPPKGPKKVLARAGKSGHGGSKRKTG